ncbi:Mss4-like protein [Favolaschia claudopus]|uniref:Mss4-like protein n=1 Tax=Favolaschia claudopus TaxID=2862362 RepID=A0AAW0CW22_9AGAR
MTSADDKTYEGNCHCGAIKFSVSLPSLETSPDPPLHSCGCSICTKKGYLNVFVPKSAITVTKGGGSDGLGAGVLADYTFNSKQVLHRFCPQCGTPFGMLAQDLPDDGIVALNARMFRDVDLWSLGVKENAGPQTPLAYTPPVFHELEALRAEPLPEGEKIYPGSCHCGAITFALKSPWLLEKTGPADVDNNQVAECDCSTCIRFAGFYTYPTPLTRVPMHISPPDALSVYFSAAGSGFGCVTFCRICGCHVGQKLVGPPAERVAKLPEHVQAIVREKLQLRPVHVRALDFVLGLTEEDRAEWGRVKASVKRERGSQTGKPYVVPE